MAKRISKALEPISKLPVESASAETNAPDVILDFIFEDGLLYVAIENIGAKPALKVSTRFNRKFFGAGGSEEISGQALFQNIEFLAPKKKITAFIDTGAAYFARKEPEKITATLGWRDPDGKACRAVISHDLRIYRELGFVKKRESGG